MDRKIEFTRDEGCHLTPVKEEDNLIFKSKIDFGQGKARSRVTWPNMHVPRLSRVPHDDRRRNYARSLDNARLIPSFLSMPTLFPPKLSQTVSANIDTDAAPFDRRKCDKCRLRF